MQSLPADTAVVQSRPLRFGMVGAGFWAPYQLAGWGEVGGVACVAIANRTRAKAEALAARFDVPAVYDTVEAMLSSETLDFVDVVTAAEHHRPAVQCAADHRLPVICQKPLAPTEREAELMVAICREACVPLLVHENWRWQRPIRALKAVLDSGELGRPFRAHLRYTNSFPVFDNQPFLKTSPRFILLDMGSHILDVARFLFGEAYTLHATTDRLHPDIAGEDVATVKLTMAPRADQPRTTVICELNYAGRIEHDRFPETFIHVEGEHGAVELGPDYHLHTTTARGTLKQRVPPPVVSWAEPGYQLVHAAMVDCQRDLLRALRTGQLAETTGADNLETMRLVFAAYDSAEHPRLITLPRARRPHR